MGFPWPFPGLDFAIYPQARRYVRPNRVRHPTDCEFASGCSPPRLMATQLPSATGSGHLPEGDFHPSDRACFPGARTPVFTGVTTFYETVKVELHWYEAHGIGRKKMKIKRFLG